MSQPLEFENAGYNAPGGLLNGASSTKKIGFYGVLPVTRPVTASTNNVSTTSSMSTSTAGGATTSWGFTSQAEINNMIAAVSSIQWTLKALGLQAGGVDTLINRSNRLYEQLDYGAPDGAVMGRTSTDLIGFYGVTPVARTVTTTLNISTTTTVSLSTIGTATTSWAFKTATEFTAICTVVSTMQFQLKALGLMV